MLKRLGEVFIHNHVTSEDFCASKPNFKTVIFKQRGLVNASCLLPSKLEMEIG
jgi:hypothetical protein